MRNKFPLEAVLMLRRNMEALQAVKLKEIKDKRRVLLEELSGVGEEIGRLASEKPSLSSAFELASGQKYSELLYRRCDLIRSEIQKTAARESAQRKELLAALKERKKMEKLKEIWAEKRALELAKAEAVEMDETARVQFARSGR